MLKYLVLPLSLIVFACWQGDEGLILPGNPKNQSVLATFHGRAFNQKFLDGSYAMDPSRSLEINNPKIAIVWQFISPKEFVFTPSDAVVSTASPYEFTLELRQPPPAEILNAPDLALGTFWLYSDRNGNGRLDRRVHPEMEKLYRKIDSLESNYRFALSQTRVYGEARAGREDVLDTYYVGRYGTLTARAGEREDTLFASSGPATAGVWSSILDARYRILSDLNRWEAFFALRKRDNDYYRRIRTYPGYVYAVDVPYRRKLL